MKLIIFIIFIKLCLLTIVKAQINEIDNLIIVTDSILYSENNTELFNNSKLIYDKSKSSNYDRGILYGSFFLAKSAGFQNDKKNLVKYTFLAESLARKQKNYYILTNVLYLKGLIYKEVELCDKALQSINEGLYISNNINQKDIKYYIKGLLLILKSSCALYSGISEKEYLKLNLEAMTQLKKAKKPFNFDYNYTNIALAYINLGRIDSAEYFFSKSINTYKNSYSSGVSYLCLAAIEYEKNNTLLSLDYNITALKKLKHLKRDDYIIQSYKLFIDLYSKLGDIDNVKKNDLLYTKSLKKQSETNEKLKKSLLIQLIEKAEKEQSEKREEINKRTTIIIFTIIISVLLLTVAFIFYKKEIKKSKLKSKLIENKKGKLSLLENKINDSFAEVLDLAKNDDPGFLPRFKEVYSEFYQKLTTKYPDLTIGQLRFCCMLRLNFSTKEIAYYHHLTVKGVQTRKNRLRKQLNIPSDVDLNKWMIGIDQNIENP